MLAYNNAKKTNFSKSDFDWSQSRIIFICREFSEKQKMATDFKDLSIELWEVRRYANDTLMFSPIGKSKHAVSISPLMKSSNNVIEKYESLIKALRHHLFSTLESVKEVPVADLLSYEQPTKYIVSDTEYSNNTDLTPVLTANKAFILGYTDEVEGIYDKGPCIILDDFTLDFKIVEFPFKVKSSAIKILSAKTTVSLRYIFEYLKFLDLNTEEHKRHYIAEIEPMSIELPEEDTIKSIAFLFDLMDKRRKGLERDQQLLKSQKDYLLREIFI